MTEEVPRRRASDRQISSSGSPTPEPAGAPELGTPEGNPASTLGGRQEEHFPSPQRQPGSGSRERRLRDIEWNGPERRLRDSTSQARTEQHW